LQDNVDIKQLAPEPKADMKKARITAGFSCFAPNSDELGDWNLAVLIL